MFQKISATFKSVYQLSTNQNTEFIPILLQIVV